jgi:hypothetical protein
MRRFHMNPSDQANETAIRAPLTSDEEGDPRIPGKDQQSSLLLFL